MTTRSHNLKPAAGRGFTLIELLMTIAIIALLIAMSFVAVRGVQRRAGSVYDQQAVRSMATGVDQFKAEAGFDLPLVYDGAPLAVAGPEIMGKPGIFEQGSNAGNLPVLENQNAVPPALFVAVYSRNADIDFLRGGKDRAGGNVINLAGPGWQDARYSNSSLAIYMGGGLAREIDGAGGSQMSEPKSDGSFKGRKGGRGSPRVFEPFVDVGEGGIELRQHFAAEKEYDEHGANYDNRDTARPNSIALIDRYGRAYRYYRWEQGRNSVDAGNAADIGKVEESADLNIPAILLDPVLYLEQQSDRTVDASGGDTKLRSARWAIVGAGPDGLFGTEDIEDIERDGGALPPAAQAELRKAAMSDNVVEVGQ